MVWLSYLTMIFIFTMGNIFITPNSGQILICLNPVLFNVTEQLSRKKNILRHSLLPVLIDC